jgi:hypothetical protein
MASDLATVEAAEPPAPPPRSGRFERVRTALDALFPEAEATPVSRRAIGLAVLAVAAGTAISLGRTTGAGPFQSIWEEDARNLLTDALMRPGAFNLVTPYVGYFQLLPRMMAEVAAFVPLSYAAAALSIQGAVAAALLALAVYVASGAHLRHPLARLLVSAPMLFAPVAENFRSEIYNRPATVQFFLVYAMFWLILWVPKRRAARILLGGIVALSAVSTFLVVVFVPLAAARLAARRDRLSLVILGSLLAGAALQLAGLVFDLTNRDFEEPRYNPVWALSTFVIWAVPHSMLGWRFTGLPVEDVLTAGNLPVILIAWAIVAAAVVVAVRRLTAPSWLLALVAAAHAVALCCMSIMSAGQVHQRYLFAVEMLLFAAVTAVLLPKAGAGRRALVPLAAFAVFVLAIGAVNYRHTDTYRHDAPRWTEQVDRAAAQCNVPGMREVVIRSGPAPWYSLVTVPCHVIKRNNWCQPEYCAQIGAPPAPDPRRNSRHPAAGSS